MFPLNKRNPRRLWAQFWNEQSGQGTVELMGYIIFASLLTYLFISQVMPAMSGNSAGSNDFTPTVKSEFNSMYSKLSGV